jgi:hypothetical protein
MVDFNLDQIASEIDSGTFDSGNGGSPAPMENTTQSQQAFDPNLVIPYKARGKDISEPLSTVIQRASMGYDYAQLMQQHKQREAEIEARAHQISELEQRWKPYDEYASTNPQWADHVKQSWENRFSFGQQSQNQEPRFESNAQNSALPPEVAAKIEKMESFIGQYESEKQMRVQAEQDAALATEINSIQSEYPDIDLRATDPMTGESAEQQIIRHAQAHGISNFRAAFRDYMFDKLLARGQTQAKEVVAKQMQSQVKNGVIGQSNSPMLQPQVQGNMRGQSYHSLMDIAAKELGF